MNLQGKLTILAQTELAFNIFEMTLTGKLVQQMRKPGQFLNIKIPSSALLLRRPISLHEINIELNQCKIIYRIEGAGTKQLSELKAGNEIDVIGPLGNGFDIEAVRTKEKILIIGGGIGTPPMYQLAKALKLKDAELTTVLGFASQNVMFHLDKFAELGSLFVTTDDGSFGTAGHAGVVIEQLLLEQHFDAVYACGAPGMLHMVNERFRNHPRAYLSMEARMACGIGACYACVCHIDGDSTQTKSVKVCDQGPIFKTGKVVI
ncbi:MULTISPECIES: dihydroorotate dehydrogenase electron transfer subunit [unclassified Enterococcus]|uniref:dihydroorotate dehydrogenase electron transfer subunit n=1 Tax=unclassified Enterococcus TaxID=2608891 RepID=UPI0015536AB8|nr:MULTISPECIES: dihydroorotate dehydrogenase electron transfer subunit [unclassified Enterococcus]MBS7576649.1 dihydroorotate dehydrogenase electron transfer subunit [Enterococcus sp. MMGLQ5-2]MBS7583864.1 dihydroorotate dehydrogenase electron transfer subunit [Enterococcus sp. MMGLQ5-1]NPD11725.1 dihydroorotate dehydrogenase electron transfer subunit [Enterococcus sp. MMGLQ5-1]NPD36486.1 dihydroorotate dehydrogenase electron transfer subunit [Enterococcus sp. MMGLQ5-2]